MKKLFNENSMKKNVCTTVLILAFIMTGNCFSGNAAENDKKSSISKKADENAVKQYYRLRELYSKWHVGMFGSRRYYEIQVEELLRGLIGKRMTSGNDFRLIYPSGSGDVYISPALFSMRWLRLNGKIETGTLDKILKKRGLQPEFMKRSWRSDFTVSFSGILKAYRLGRNMKGDYINLYFYSIDVNE